MLRYCGQYICYDTEAELVGAAGKMGDVANATDTKLRYMFDGTSWFPTDGLRVLRSTVAVDGKVVANTKILTLPAATFRIAVLGARIELLTTSGVVLAPTISLGTNASTYDNLFASNLLTNLLTAAGLTSAYGITLAKNIPPLAGGSHIYLSVPTGGGATATGYTSNVDVCG